jgi:hypothetical protein
MQHHEVDDEDVGLTVLYPLPDGRGSVFEGCIYIVFVAGAQGIYLSINVIRFRDLSYDIGMPYRAATVRERAKKLKR